MISEHYSELAKLDRSYWWFLVRHRIVRRLITRSLGRKPASILDIGAGAGGFLSEMVDEGFIARTDVLALEPSPAAQVVLAARQLPVLNAPLSDLATVKVEPFPEVVTLLDVLEHLDEPVRTLTDISRRLPEGGHVVILVPALPSLWSTWDELLHHKRRYTRRTLREHLVQGGFDIVALQYCFAGITLPAWYRARFGMASADAGQFARVSPWLNALLVAVFDPESRFPWWPLGTTLAAVARRRTL
jgi:SAM-dependent methyltransferase